jgi:RNA 2',3'-cyclic 3'-phosphodiesterase
MRPNRPGFAPNWFVAVPVPAEGWFEQMVTAPPEGVRRFHPEDIHMTVAFLGGVSEQDARAGWQALSWPVGAVTASLGAVIPMGAPHRYSALSIELIDGREELEKAIAACRDAICDAAGARRENRPAKAHITVARPNRRAGEAEREAGLRWAKRLDLKKQVVTLDSVALYTWADDRKTRQFKIVERLGSTT